MHVLPSLIREHPYQSIGAAFGLGRLIGVLVTRKRSIARQPPVLTRVKASGAKAAKISPDVPPSV